MQGYSRYIRCRNLTPLSAFRPAAAGKSQNRSACGRSVFTPPEIPLRWFSRPVPKFSRPVFSPASRSIIPLVRFCCGSNFSPHILSKRRINKFAVVIALNSVRGALQPYLADSFNVPDFHSVKDIAVILSDILRIFAIEDSRDAYFVKHGKQVRLSRAGNCP